VPFRRSQPSTASVRARQTILHMPLFNRRNSKEERVGKEESAAPESAPPPPSPAAGRVSSQEAEAINDLLKATGNGERVGPIRERRLSNGNIDPFKLKEKVVSPELAAINNLIKEAHSEGTQNALRHRRRSKEIPGGDQAPSSRSTGTEETPTDGAAASDRPSDEKVKVGDGATTGNSEVAAINARISQDRRVRRASKEFQEVQLAAAVKSVTVEKELEKAENEAEAQGMAAPKAVSDAAARGAAKAAATKAEGFFIPRSEYLSLQSRLNSLEAELAQLKEERKESHSLFQTIAMRFHRTDSKNSEGSPTGKRDVDGQSFVRRILENSGDSFVKRMRSPSPSALRRQASKGLFKELGKSGKSGKSPSSTSVLSIS